MEQNEHATIDRILNGEAHLYGVLIDRYKEGLYRHCFKFVRDEDRAEDIAQETFIKAYTHLETYNSNYRFSTWLYRIATNKALSEIRKKRPLPLDEEMQIMSTLADTDQRAKDDEIHQAVARLSDKYRTVVTLHYWDGESYDQIAKRMDTTTGTIKSWMSRAKKELRKDLL